LDGSESTLFDALNKKTFKYAFVGAFSNS